MHQGDRDVQPALHSARVRPGDAAGRIREAELVEQLVRAPIEPPPAQALEVALQPDVLAPRQVAIDSGRCAATPIERRTCAGSVSTS